MPHANAVLSWMHFGDLHLTQAGNQNRRDFLALIDTDNRHLVGHIVKSAIWVEQRVKIAEEALGEKIPAALANVLQHIILSHHEKPEFGAASFTSAPAAMRCAALSTLPTRAANSNGVIRLLMVPPPGWADSDLGGH